MNTCSSCEHWTKPHEDANYREARLCGPVDPDTFEPMNRGFEVRICRMPTQTLFEAPIEANGFGLTDGSGYHAALATAEGFGCLRHEARTRGQGADAGRVDITTIGDKEPRYISAYPEGEL
jgi:hypothetical protein